jgi:hypothetical protein
MGPLLNPIGKWSFEGMHERYARCCKRFKVHYVRPEVRALDSERPWWITELMDCFIARMKTGDLAAGQLGIDLMQEDGGFFCGSIVKSNIPRALAKCALSEDQKNVIRARVVEMLLRKFMPKEFRQYAWLVRRFGLGAYRAEVETKADRSDPWVDWYVEFMTEPSPQGQPNQPWARRMGSPEREAHDAKWAAWWLNREPPKP